MTVARVELEYRILPLDAIDPPANPSRETMNEEKLDELTSSIRQHGVLQPLIVARTGDRHEIVAGHRRYLAARRAQRVGVPALVYPSSDAALEAVKYAENRHRENLSAAEEAIWFSELLESHCENDTDRLAEFLGEKRAYVEGRLNLFRGDEAVFDALRAEKITIGVAQQLNRVTDRQHCRYLLDAAIRGGATVAVAVGWVTDWQRSVAAAGGTPPPVSNEPLSGSVAPPSPFKCYCCEGTDNVHVMTPIYVHEYCRLAVLDKLVAELHGRG